ncbi:MAG: hypothetical protein N3G22_01080 [Candidatus Micrarchaeota archaeon]|nr:hypothetical protein [Candidatus Micrarchaeota archaeon]
MQPVLFREEEKKDKEGRHVALVTFQPIGNPLEGMGEQERALFFDSIFRLLKMRLVENVDLARQAAGEKVGAVSLARHPAHFVVEKRLRLANKATNDNSEFAQRHIADAIFEYSHGSESVAAEIFDEFKSRLKKSGYKADDLMAVLLLVIEDHAASKEEAQPHAGDSSSSGSLVPNTQHSAEEAAPAKLLPRQLIESIKSAKEVRLASVREMLRYYYQRNPREFHQALCRVLSISKEEEGDSEYVLSRLLSAISALGTFEISQRILAEIKKQEEMDVVKCLLKIGYVVDGEKKKIIFGKRTCGSRQQAAQISNFILSQLGKKKLARKDTRPSKEGVKGVSVQLRKPAARD